MRKLVFKRYSITLDAATNQKCRELAHTKGQSVSAMVRWIIGRAHEEAIEGKKVEHGVSSQQAV